MDAQLRELIPFLRDKNPQVRQIALETLLSQTPPGSPHRNIFLTGLQGGGLQAKNNEPEIIKTMKLLCRDTLAIAHDAFRALVNLSDSPLLQASLSEAEFLKFLLAYILNPQSILADLASMILSNLTSSALACSAILSAKVTVIPTPGSTSPFYATQARCATSPPPDPYPTGESQEVLALPLLVDAFSQGVQVDESADKTKRTRKADLHFLASVFANISSAPIGRNFFLTPYPADFFNPEENFEFPLGKIVAFTEHKDTIRRGGVASTIKNCAFYAAGHKAIVSPETESVTVPLSTHAAPGINALPYILLPLAGPEEFDLESQEKLPDALQFLPPTKKREPDSTLRLTHIETLLLLCHTRWGRDFLRDNGVYEIVRAAHLDEKVDKVSEHIERLVTLLKGEEPSDPKHLEEADVIEPDPNAELTHLTLAPTGAAPKAIAPAAPDSDDDEDNRIEEV